MTKTIAILLLVLAGCSGTHVPDSDAGAERCGCAL